VLAGLARLSCGGGGRGGARRERRARRAERSAAAVKRQRLSGAGKIFGAKAASRRSRRLAMASAARPRCCCSPIRGVSQQQRLDQHHICTRKPRTGQQRRAQNALPAAVRRAIAESVALRNAVCSGGRALRGMSS